MISNAAKLIGIEEEIKITDGVGILTVTLGEQHFNDHGTIHGGILYAISEEAVGQYVGAMGKSGVAMEGDSKFYRPANAGEALTIKVIERKVGRRVGVYNVELLNQEGKILVDSSYTIMFT